MWVVCPPWNEKNDNENYVKIIKQVWVTNLLSPNEPVYKTAETILLEISTVQSNHIRLPAFKQPQAYGDSCSNLCGFN